VSSELLKKEGAGWSQYAVRIVLQDPVSVFRDRMSFDRVGISRLFSTAVLFLPLYFLQFSEHVGPKVKDFAVQPFQDFRPSRSDQGRKSHGVELAMPRFGDIVELE